MVCWLERRKSKVIQSNTIMVITVLKMNEEEPAKFDGETQSPKCVSEAAERSWSPSGPQDENAPGSELEFSVSKPFFIMDWLDDVDSRHLEIAQEMLKTPQRARLSPRNWRTDTSLSPKKLFPVSSSNRSHRSKPKIQEPVLPESPFRKRSIEIGNAWNTKGIRKAKQTKWEKALACWENALEIRSQVLGETHADVANTCNNMGIALGKLKRFHEGAIYLNRALKIRTEHYGREHVEVAATLHNIGNLYHQAGDLDSAIECFHESKSLQATMLGHSHVQVARACVAIGHCQFQADNYCQAGMAYREAIGIFFRAGMDKDSVEVQATFLDLEDADRFAIQNGAMSEA